MDNPTPSPVRQGPDEQSLNMDNPTTSPVRQDSDDQSLNMDNPTPSPVRQGSDDQSLNMDIPTPSPVRQDSDDQSLNMANPTTSPVRQDSEDQSLNSKVSAETLYGCIEKVLLASQQKPRHFIETVDLQVALKKYNAKKDKRLAGSVRLPHKPLKKFEVCVLGDEEHCDEAKDNELDCIDLRSLKELSKKKKRTKKLAKKYRGFMASESVIEKMPRSLGPRLHKKRKFPTLLTHEESMLAKLDEVRATIKFHVKKSPFIGVAVGNVKMSPDNLAENINFAVNHIVPLLKRHWQNVRSLHIKSTMGPPQKLY